jgi:hypothetical protein
MAQGHWRTAMAQSIGARQWRKASAHGIGARHWRNGTWIGHRNDTRQHNVMASPQIFEHVASERTQQNKYRKLRLLHCRHTQRRVIH